MGPWPKELSFRELRFAPRRTTRARAEKPVQIEGRANEPFAMAVVIRWEITKRTRLDPILMLTYHTVTRRAESPDGEKFPVAHVEQTAPDHHRRSLAGGSRKVAFINEQNGVTRRAKEMIKAGTVDPAAHDDDVEDTLIQLTPLFSSPREIHDLRHLEERLPLAYGLRRLEVGRRVNGRHYRMGTAELPADP